MENDPSVEQNQQITPLIQWFLLIMPRKGLPSSTQVFLYCSYLFTHLFSAKINVRILMCFRFVFDGSLMHRCWCVFFETDVGWSCIREGYIIFIYIWFCSTLWSLLCCNTNLSLPLFFASAHVHVMFLLVLFTEKWICYLARVKPPCFLDCF